MTDIASASYTYEEYKTAADMLYKTVKLRAESIDGQIAGTIPSTDEGQRQDSSALVDASEIDVEVMGQFDMGGGNGGFSKPSGDSGSENTTDDQAETPETGDQSEGFQNPFGTPPDGDMPNTGNFDPGNMPDNFGDGSSNPFGTPPDGNMPDMGDSSSNPFGTPPDGNMPDMGNFDPNNMPDNFGDGSSNPFGTPPDGNMPNMGDSAQSSDDSSRQPSSFPGSPDSPAGNANMKNLVTYGICLAVMLTALILAARFRRRR